MSIFQKKTRVEQLEQLSSDNYLLTLDAPQITCGAKPGQFVMLGVGQGKDPLLRRPFSINRIGSNGRLRILFKVVGRGTRILSHSVRGDILPILGPLGNGFSIDSHKPACLVGGGMGIAPILFLAEYLNGIEGRKAADTVILGGRNREELEPLIGEFESLDIQLYTTTDDGSLGVHGLVTDVLKDLDLAAETTVYSCGPKPMLAAVSRCLRGSNVECQVSVESVMACGMGACLGCSVPSAAGGYVNVCTDGPVFRSEELAWFRES